MPTVQVRDFPPTLYEQLQQTAEREHRSVPQQIIAITEKYVCRNRSHESSSGNMATHLAAGSPVVEREALFAELQAAEPDYQLPTDFPSVADLIREDRDAR